MGRGRLRNDPSSPLTRKFPNTSTVKKKNKKQIHSKRSQDFGGAHLGWLQKAAPADLQRASKDVDAKIAAVEERLSARLLKLEQLAAKLAPTAYDDRGAQVAVLPCCLASFCKSWQFEYTSPNLGFKW